MHRRTLLTGLATASPLALTLPGVASANTNNGNDSKLQGLLEAVHEAGMPGLFAEVRADRRRYRLASGVADVQTGRPVQPWFQHRIGSITKTFVATVVLQLVGEGRLRLDDLVVRHLPEFSTGEITVRMLLNHTSGLGNYTNSLIQTPDDVIELGKRTMQPAQLVRIGLQMPPTGPPAGPWSYTNTGYILLGLLIERLTGHSYASELSRRILRPLNLRHTYAPGGETRIRESHMAAYIPWIDGNLRDFSVYNMTWAWAAGELVSTAADLNRFFRALLGGRLLNRYQMKEMQTTVPFDAAHPELGGYGLGLYWLGLPGAQRAWGHDGGVFGQTTLSLHADRQVTLAENMNFYAVPGEPHPIDEARAVFVLEALGVAAAAQARAAVPPRLLWAPDLLLRVKNA